MISLLTNLFRSRAFKKADFKFNGKIPGGSPAIFIFPEDRTPFLPAAGLFYSLLKYHGNIMAIGLPEISQGFKYHFPHVDFLEFNPQKPVHLEKQDSVIYLGSIYRDVFYNFPEICRGKFSVATRGFDSHYNLLVDTEFNSYPDFVKNFLKVLGIPDFAGEFLDKIRPPQDVRKNHLILDTKNPSRFRKHLMKTQKRIYSTTHIQDTEFIGDLPFSEKLKVLSSACCLVSEDSLFTGYALHYQIPVYGENCSKYFKNPLCKDFEELVK